MPMQKSPIRVFSHENIAARLLTISTSMPLSPQELNLEPQQTGSYSLGMFWQAIHSPYDHIQQKAAGGRPGLAKALSDRLISSHAQCLL